MRGTATRLAFTDLTPEYKNYNLYEIVHGARIKEQCELVKQSLRIVREASTFEVVPETVKQWETLCEAVRLDGELSDPGSMLAHTLHFERPGMVKEFGRLHESLGAYLTANNLPSNYRGLTYYAEEQAGVIGLNLVDLSVKSQFDVPFDEICDYARKEHVEVYQYNAARTAIREAWLIDRIGSGREYYEDLKANYLDRLYTTLHSEVSDVPGADRFLERLDEEAKDPYAGSMDARRVWGITNASFLGDNFKAYLAERAAVETNHADMPRDKASSPRTYIVGKVCGFSFDSEKWPAVEHGLKVESKIGKIEFTNFGNGINIDLETPKPLADSTVHEMAEKLDAYGRGANDMNVDLMKVLGIMQECIQNETIEADELPELNDALSDLESEMKTESLEV